jgi:hypothetical protein
MNAITNNINKAKQFSDLWSECGVALILAGLNGKRIIIIACALILIGYILMSGSSGTEQSFNPAIFSTRRIVIAPVLCLAGYLLIILGILRKRW